MNKISVIIPCYNTEGYIVKCLDALSLQIFKDFDVILVDDCSTDATGDVIKAYISKSSMKIIYVRNEINYGPSKSRLYGANISKSKWLAFCDSDDWYEKDFLLSMITKAESDNCDIVFCGYQNVIGNKIDKHPLVKSETILYSREAMLLNVDSLCMTLVKRDIFIQTPQPDIRNGEDMAIIPLMIQSSIIIGALDKVLYNYYLRPGSASQTPTYKMIDSLILSYEHIRCNINNDYYNEMEYIGIRNLIYACLLNLFKFSYNKKKALEILCQFEKFFPKWNRSPYINKLPLYKRVFVWCASKKLYLSLYILSHIHTLMIKKYTL